MFSPSNLIFWVKLAIQEFLKVSLLEFCGFLRLSFFKNGPFLMLNGSAQLLLLLSIALLAGRSKQHCIPQHNPCDFDRLRALSKTLFPCLSNPTSSCREHSVRSTPSIWSIAIACARSGNTIVVPKTKSMKLHTTLVLFWTEGAKATLECNKRFLVELVAIFVEWATTTLPMTT